MNTNRREFLKGTGGLALTGWIGTSGLAAAAAATTPESAAHAGSIEHWLLETGRPTLGEDVYRAVANGKL